MAELERRLAKLEGRFLPKPAPRRPNELEGLVRKLQEDSLSYDEKLRLALYVDCFWLLGVIPGREECWTRLRNGETWGALLIKDRWDEFIFSATGRKP